MTEPHFTGSENPQQPPGGQFPPPYQGQQPHYQGQQPPYQPQQPAYPGAQPAGYQGGYPPAYYGVDAYGRPLSDKSKLTAGLLQIFLGGFGVGRFYLWFADFAPVPTLEAFAEVIASVRSAASA